MSMTGDNVEFYEFSEYEQQLLAAGWVKPEEIDPEYLAYKKRLGKWEFAEWGMSYEQWRDDVETWNRLNNRFRREIEPILGNPDTHLTYDEERVYKELCTGMLDIEQRLGH